MVLNAKEYEVENIIHIGDAVNWCKYFHFFFPRYQPLHCVMYHFYHAFSHLKIHLQSNEITISYLLYSGRKILKTSSWGFCVCLFFVGLVGWGFLVLFFKIRISLSFPCSGLIKFRNAPCTDWGFKCIMYYSSGLASFIEGTGGIKKWAKYKSQRPPWVQHLSVNLKTGMLF